MDCKFVILFTAVIAACAAASVIQEGPSAETSFQPVLIGTVNGVSYFAESVVQSWANAKTVCVSMGMTLATIPSRQVFDSLNASHATTFTGLHWIAGRDALELRQFSWDDTHEELSSEYLIYRPDLSDPVRTCVGFFSDPEQSNLRSHLCTGSAKFICAFKPEGSK